MRVTGYRLKGYDATYEKTTFDVRIHKEKKNCVLEVMDINSGMTFIFDQVDDSGHSRKKK